jgi:transcriptional regulator with XRE-family HTH domain
MSRDVGYLPRRVTGEPGRVLVAGKGESESDRTGRGQEGLPDSENRQELAKVVAGRMAELHLTRIKLAELSKTSVATIREMEHPRKARDFGHNVLEAISKALGLSPDHLARVAYRPPSPAPDPIVQAMMVALAPYLEKIDAIPRLQADVAAIKADLGITVDSIHEVGDGMDIRRRPSQPSDERRDAQGLAGPPEISQRPT